MTELAGFGSRSQRPSSRGHSWPTPSRWSRAPGFALYHVAKRQFCSAYWAGKQGVFHIRPDVYRLGGRSCVAQNLSGYLQQVFGY